MAVLKYFNPTTQQWEVIASGGGGGTDEVAIQPDEPGEHPDLWVDTDDDSAVGGGGGGVTDHGDLTGLENDDHPQYKAYADEIVTVSTADPPATPARNGLLWFKVAP